MNVLSHSTASGDSVSYSLGAGRFGGVITWSIPAPRLSFESFACSLQIGDRTLMQPSQFPLPFAIGVVFALVATVFHFVIVARLSSAGVRVKLFFLMPREQLNIYRSYRYMGLREKWPMWPLYALCLAVAGMVIAWIVGVATFPK